MTAFMRFYSVINFLADSTKHYLLAVCVGVLVFYATQIISITWSEIMARAGVSRIWRRRVAASMLIIGLLLAVALSLLSHLWLDRFTLWFVTPLGPPLNIPNLLGPPIIPGLNA